MPQIRPMAQAVPIRNARRDTCDRTLLDQTAITSIVDGTPGIFTGELPAVDEATVTASADADAETDAAIRATLDSYRGCVAKYGAAGAYAFLNPGISAIELIYLGVFDLQAEQTPPQKALQPAWRRCSTFRRSIQPGSSCWKMGESVQSSSHPRMERIRRWSCWSRGTMSGLFPRFLQLPALTRLPAQAMAVEPEGRDRLQPKFVSLPGERLVAS